MATKVGQLTIWSTLAVIAIVIVAILLATRN